MASKKNKLAAINAKLAGKTKNPVGRPKKQTKAGVKADKRIKAKHPGKRTSASGETYYENRNNRSDENRTKKFADGGSVAAEHRSICDGVNGKPLTDAEWDGFVKSRYYDPSQLPHRISNQYRLYKQVSRFADGGTASELHPVGTMFENRNGDKSYVSSNIDGIYALKDTEKRPFADSTHKASELDAMIASGELTVLEETFDLPGGSPAASKDRVAGILSVLDAYNVAFEVAANDDDYDLSGLQKLYEAFRRFELLPHRSADDVAYEIRQGKEVWKSKDDHTREARIDYHIEFLEHYNFAWEAGGNNDEFVDAMTELYKAWTAYEYSTDLSADDLLHQIKEGRMFAKGGKAGGNKSVKLYPYRKKFVLVDTSTGNMWANELFASKEEAKDFATQNKLTVTSEETTNFKPGNMSFANGGTTPSGWDDEHAAREIELYADNNADLYRQRYTPIMANLKKKLKKGTFDVNLAAKLWLYFVQDADKRYQKEHGTPQRGFMLSVNDRKKLAMQYAEFTKAEYDANGLDGFSKGGEVGEDFLQKVMDAGDPMVWELIDENGLSKWGFENSYNQNTVPNETKAYPGFIPYTDGGSSTTWIEFLSSMQGSGRPLPTNTLRAMGDRMQDQAERAAADRFREGYPEIVEAIGDDNISYHGLNEEGYSSEAEELNEWEQEYMQDESIVVGIDYYLYDKNNSRAKDGKYTCSVSGKVNMEAPYHRDGFFEDYWEHQFTFSTVDGFKKKFAKALEDISVWLGGGYSDQGKPLAAGRGFASGGSATEDSFARGGAVKVANGDSRSYVEGKTPFHGANLEGKLLENGDYVVLSYGYFPLWLFCASEGKWYGNAEKFSVSTSKQQGQSRPGYDTEMVSRAELEKKMTAHYDLGGIMVQDQNPVLLQNLEGAHAGSAIGSQSTI